MTGELDHYDDPGNLWTDFKIQIAKLSEKYNTDGEELPDREEPEHYREDSQG